ncbi:Glucose and ribitol dehydrogenase [Ancistrocladus abbreviatus]
MTAFTYVKDIEEKDADDTLRMLLHAEGDNAENPIAIAAHIGYDDNCKNVIDEVVSRYGRIDILVNNAAEQHLSNSVEEITEERLERTFRTNIFS